MSKLENEYEILQVVPEFGCGYTPVWMNNENDSNYVGHMLAKQVTIPSRSIEELEHELGIK